MGMSAIYEGRVWHHRRTPRTHRFSRSLWMPCLDLAELDDVLGRSALWSRRPAPVWFRREDHLAPHDRPLADAVRDVVERDLGRRPTGTVMMLGHLRTFGWCFNPITLYWCFDAPESAGTDAKVVAIVAEVRNTPWKQRHVHALAVVVDPDGSLRAEFAKELHVSPFLSMAHSYHLRSDVPGEGRLRVRIEVRHDDAVVLDTGLSLQRRPMTAPEMRRMLWRHPLLTMRVSAAIHVEAAKLWCKRVPVHRHPAGRTTTEVAA